MFTATMKLGESRDISANGNYVHLDEGVKIEIVNDQGHRWTIGAREGVSLPPFERLSITNWGSDDDVIKLRFGFGQLKAAQDGDLVEVSNLPINANKVMTWGQVYNYETGPLWVKVLEQPPISVSATVNQSNQISTAPDVSTVAATATVIAAANATRKELMIKNPSANAESVRIGGMNVAANRGFELEPGESAVLTTTAAVYAYCPAVQPLSITELEFV